MIPSVPVQNDWALAVSAVLTELGKMSRDHWRGSVTVRFGASGLDSSASLHGAARPALEALAKDLRLSPHLTSSLTQRLEGEGR